MQTNDGANSLRRLRRDWWKTRLCTSCVSPLGRIISRGGICPQCGLRVCKNCRSEITPGSGAWVCVLCTEGGISQDIFGKTRSLGRDARSIRRSWTISTPQRGQTSSPVLKSYTALHPEDSFGASSASNLNSPGSGGGGHSTALGSRSQGANDVVKSRQFHSLPRMSSDPDRSKKSKRSSNNQEFEKENIKRHRSFQTTLHPYQAPAPPSPSASINFIEDPFWDYYDYDINDTPSGSPRYHQRNIHQRTPRFRSLSTAASSGTGTANFQRQNSFRSKLESDMDRLLHLNLRAYSNRSSCERSLGETYDYDYSKNCGSSQTAYNSFSDTDLNENSKYDQEEFNISLSPRRFRTENTKFYKFATVTPTNMSPASASRKDELSKATAPVKTMTTPVKPERKSLKRSCSLNTYDGKKLFSPLKTYVVIMKENVVPPTCKGEEDYATSFITNANVNAISSSGTESNKNNGICNGNGIKGNNGSSVRQSSTGNLMQKPYHQPINSPENEFRMNHSSTKFHSLPRERVIRIEREDSRFSRSNKEEISNKERRNKNISRVEITRSASSVSPQDFNNPGPRKIGRSQSHREISSLANKGYQDRPQAQPPFLSIVNLGPISPSSAKQNFSNSSPRLNDSATLPLMRSKKGGPGTGTGTSLTSPNQKQILNSFLKDSETAPLMEKFLKSQSQNGSPRDSTVNRVGSKIDEKCSTSKKDDFIHEKKRNFEDFQHQQSQTFDNYLRQCATFPRAMQKQKHSSLQPEDDGKMRIETEPKLQKRHTSTTLITHDDDNFVKSSGNVGDYFRPFGDNSRFRAQSEMQLNLNERASNRIVSEQDSRNLNGKMPSPQDGWYATLPHLYIRKHKEQKSSFASQRHFDDAFSKLEKTRIYKVEKEIEKDIDFQKTQSLDRRKNKPKTSFLDSHVEDEQVQLNPPVASPRLKRKTSNRVNGGSIGDVPKITGEHQHWEEDVNESGANYPKNKYNSRLPNEPRPSTDLHTNHSLSLPHLNKSTLDERKKKGLGPLTTSNSGPQLSKPSGTKAGLGQSESQSQSDMRIMQPISSSSNHKLSSGLEFILGDQEQVDTPIATPRSRRKAFQHSPEQDEVSHNSNNLGNFHASNTTAENSIRTMEGDAVNGITSINGKSTGNNLPKAVRFEPHIIEENERRHKSLANAINGNGNGNGGMRMNNNFNNMTRQHLGTFGDDELLFTNGGKGNNNAIDIYSSTPQFDYASGEETGQSKSGAGNHQKGFHSDKSLKSIKKPRGIVARAIAKVKSKARITNGNGPANHNGNANGIKGRNGGQTGKNTHLRSIETRDSITYISPSPAEIQNQQEQRNQNRGNGASVIQEITPDPIKGLSSIGNNYITEQNQCQYSTGNGTAVTRADSFTKAGILKKTNDSPEQKVPPKPKRSSLKNKDKMDIPQKKTPLPSLAIDQLTPSSTSSSSSSSYHSQEVHESYDLFHASEECESVEELSETDQMFKSFDADDEEDAGEDFIFYPQIQLEDKNEKKRGNKLGDAYLEIEQESLHTNQNNDNHENENLINPKEISSSSRRTRLLADMKPPHKEKESKGEEALGNSADANANESNLCNNERGAWATPQQSHSHFQWLGEQLPLPPPPSTVPQAMVPTTPTSTHCNNHIWKEESHQQGYNNRPLLDVLDKGPDPYPRRGGRKKRRKGEKPHVPENPEEEREEGNSTRINHLLLPSSFYKGPPGTLGPLSQSEFFPGAGGMSSGDLTIGKFRSNVLVSPGDENGGSIVESARKALQTLSPTLNEIPVIARGGNNAKRTQGHEGSPLPSSPKNVTTVEISGDVGIVNSNAAAAFLNSRRAQLKKVNNETLWKNDVYNSGLAQLRRNNGRNDDGSINQQSFIGHLQSAGSLDEGEDQDGEYFAEGEANDAGSSVSQQDDTSVISAFQRKSVSEEDESSSRSSSTKNTVIFKGERPAATSNGEGGYPYQNCDPEIHISSFDLADTGYSYPGFVEPSSSNSVKTISDSATKSKDDKYRDSDNKHNEDCKSLVQINSEVAGDPSAKGVSGKKSDDDDHSPAGEEFEETSNRSLSDNGNGSNYSSHQVPSNKSTFPPRRRESPEGQEQEVPVVHPGDQEEKKSTSKKSEVIEEEVIIMEKSSKKGEVVNKSKIIQNALSQITASSSRSSPDGADADKSEADSTTTTEPEVESPTPLIEQFDVTSDEDSWVEETIFEDEETEIQMCRKVQPPPLDLTLHTIVEESCEESEAESGNFNSPQLDGRARARKSINQNDNELEKYFNFGINAGDNSSQGGRLSFTNDESEFSDTFSESSFSMHDDHDEVTLTGANNGRKRSSAEIDPAELASSRLEKYFYNLGLPQSMINPISSINQAADSDSVGSESESDNSVLENRKKVLKHHRRSADFEDDLGVKVSDEEDEFGFGQDGFDTIKKTTRKTKKGGTDSNLLLESSGISNSNKQAASTDTLTSSGHVLFSTSKISSDLHSKIPLAITLSNGTTSSKEESSSGSPTSPSTLKRIVGEGGKERPVIKVNRSNSFQWSSDEEVNIMMSKLRQLIRNLVKSKVESTTSSKEGGGKGKLSSSSTGNDKDKHLAYLEGELIRLMKTENLKNIVEYFSSEESDVDDVYKFIKVVKESGSINSNTDDNSDFGDIDLEELKTLQGDSTEISPKGSPAILAKVMHHIGNRLAVWMKDEPDDNDDNVTLKCAQSVSSDLNEDRFSWKGSFESALAAKRQSVGSTDSISSSDFTQDRSILRSSSLHHLANSSHHLGQVEEHKEEEESTSSLPRMTNLCNSLPRLNQPSNLSISRAQSLVMAGRVEEDSPVTPSGPIKSARYRPPGFQPVKSKRMDEEGKNSPILSQSTPVLTQDPGPLKIRSDSVGSIFHDAAKPHIPVRGQVEFGLQYNYKLACLEVRIKQCRDLAAVDSRRNRSDPYVKAYLLPDKSKAGKRKTKVKKNTLNPVFEEVLKFPLTLSDLQNRTLWLSVWHSDIFGKNEFLGEVSVDLRDRVFDDTSPQFWDLQEMSELTEDMPRGDMVIALKWLPKTEATGNLSVLVKEAKNLPPVKNGASPSSFIKCLLLSDKSRKQKTSICRRSNNPVWNQTLNFEDAGDDGLEITLWNHDLLSNNDLLGTIRLEYDHPLWASMLSRHSFWVEGSIHLT